MKDVVGSWLVLVERKKGLKRRVERGVSHVPSLFKKNFIQIITQVAFCFKKNGKVHSWPATSINEVTPKS